MDFNLINWSITEYHIYALLTVLYGCFFPDKRVLREKKCFFWTYFNKITSA